MGLKRLGSQKNVGFLGEPKATKSGGQASWDKIGQIPECHNLFIKHLVLHMHKHVLNHIGAQCPFAGGCFKIHTLASRGTLRRVWDEAGNAAAAIKCKTKRLD